MRSSADQQLATTLAGELTVAACYPNGQAATSATIAPAATCAGLPGQLCSPSAALEVIAPPSADHLYQRVAYLLVSGALPKLAPICADRE